MLSETCQQSEKSLGQLLAGLPILQLDGDASVPVTGLAYHSGRVQPGDVFVALKGLQTDGHRFIPQAIARGARVVVVEDEVPRQPGLVYVRTPDTRLALAHMAAVLADHPSQELTLIGLTGTNGKTTTSYLLEAIWQASGAQVGVIGTVNCRFGGQVRPSPVTTPESLDLQTLLRDMRTAQVSCAIMEVSSHALDLKRVHASRFDAAVFTNLSQDHLDYHQDMESYFAAKSRLFTEVLTANGAGGLAVLNLDDPWGQRLRRLLRVPVLTYGFAQGVDVRPRHYTLAPDGIQAVLETPSGPVEISSPLLGHYNLANIMAAAATALGLGLAPDHVFSGLAGIHGVDGRLEPVASPGQPLVLVDYAHTPDALQQVLKALRALPFARLITVFGCGGDRDKTKRPLMGQVAAQGSDLVIVTSDNPRSEDPLAIIDQIVAGLQELGWPRLDNHDFDLEACGYLVVPDRREAIRLAVQLAAPADVILLAGKGHETYQIVGSKRYHFDDREEARQALAARAQAQGQQGQEIQLQTDSQTDRTS